MVKEPRNIDFCTTGKTPTKDDVAKISEFIKKNKRAAKQRKVLTVGANK